MYSQNLTRGTKLTELNTKKNLQIGFFLKWMYFVNESSNIILLWTLHNVHNKNGPFLRFL